MIETKDMPVIQMRDDDDSNSNSNTKTVELVTSVDGVLLPTDIEEDEDMSSHMSSGEESAGDPAHKAFDELEDKEERPTEDSTTAEATATTTTSTTTAASSTIESSSELLPQDSNSHNNSDNNNNNSNNSSTTTADQLGSTKVTSSTTDAAAVAVTDSSNIDSTNIDSTNTTRTTTVKFSTLELREYAICPGDSPAVFTGAPLAVDWEYEVALQCTVEDYENAKPSKRSMVEMKLPAAHRLEMLKRVGFSKQEIQESIKRATIGRNRRRTTDETIGLATIEEVFQRTAKGILNATVRRKQKQDERKTLQQYVPDKASKAALHQTTLAATKQNARVASNGSKTKSKSSKVSSTKKNKPQDNSK